MRLPAIPLKLSRKEAFGDSKLRINMAPERRLKKEPSSKLKVFSRRWLELDIMKDWLVPHSNPVKAMCKVCNKVINAGKSELMKHACGQKHTQKLLKFKAGKSQTQEALDFITNSLKIGTEPCIETVEEKQSNETAGPGEPQVCNTSSNIETENSKDHQEVYKRKKIELLSKIADALDRIASSQETLAKSKSLEKHGGILAD